MSAAAEGLAVDSVTGIDLTLPIAGAGARSLAFLIDWHLRLVLALAWYVCAALLYNGLHAGTLSIAPAAGNEPGWFALIVVPSFALYFLYHPVLEVARRGRTPGKRMAGVRIVTRSGATPGAGALLLRNVFRLIDSIPVGYGVGLLTVMLSKDNVRFGDMAAGTLLVYDRSQVEAVLAPQPADARLDPAAAELVAELLQRWPALEVQARERLAVTLLERFGPRVSPPAASGEQSLHERLTALLGVR
ncbi:MAG: RDD family protein [Gammaproteobacteria bacterium]|nr:RDD family protein [Gammaproteobacteria bacterium]MBV9621761.1 RDD family protein [Gammaproteobacteria bacterium]